MTKKTRRLALFISIIIFVLESIGFVIAIGNHGWILLGFYTQESNLILLITCFIYSIVLLKYDHIPKWARTMKYLATSMVMVTFVVVITVLMPMCAGNTTFMINLLIGEANLYHHTICPLLAIFSFIFIDRATGFTVKDNLIATVPTLLYAIVTTTLNALKVIRGPYPFLFVYEQPVWASVMWFIGIVGAGYFFAFLLRLSTKKIGGRN